MNVKLENLFFSYNPDLSKENFILKNINMNIDKGDLALICGRNGSGKTTLAQMIAGLKRPTRGSVSLNGHDIHSSHGSLYKKRAGMIFQTPEDQLFARTVYEDVTFVLRRNATVSEDEMVEKSKKTLKLVGLDYEKYKDRLSFSLSNGEKRKAAIACVLINPLDLVIFDEPTVGLDHATKRSLIKMILRLKGEGKTVICVSHDINIFFKLSDKLFIVKDGEIVYFSDNISNKKSLFEDYDLINSNVKLSLMLELINELKKSDAHIKSDFNSADSALLYLKDMIG